MLRVAPQHGDHNVLSVMFLFHIDAGQSVVAKKAVIRTHVPCGLVVRISGFHPGGRGSIPRTGVYTFEEFAVVTRSRHLPEC